MSTGRAGAAPAPAVEHSDQGQGQGLSRPDWTWLLASACRAFRLPFDARLLEREFPPPTTRQTLLAALKSLGFKVGTVHPGASGQTPDKIPLPAIGFAAGDAPRPALLLRHDGQRFLYFTAGSETPQIAPLAELPRMFGELMLIGRDAPVGNLGEGDDPQPKRFGFRWFVPELMKHRRIWRDVLLASLALQIVGLTTPLLTQVTIDKVLVHHSQSTLVVIGVALVVFMLFNGAMSWLRQYLIIHTGNRIDAVLGSRVFTHLFRLPMPYFEKRPTGTLIARLHGVETIREFVTGAAVALALDLPFLLIFLAVMFLYSWELSLIALGILGLIGLLSFLVAPVFRARLNRQFMLGARNQAFVTEYVAGMETVKSLQMEPSLEKRYGDYLADYLVAGFSTRQIGNTYQVLAHALEQTLTLAILVAGALIVMRNEGFTVGMLVAFQMFASRMSQPMLRLVGLWQEFQQANLSVKRLGDILDMPSEPYALTPVRSQKGPGRIELTGVSFRYSERHTYLFKNLSLKLRPGALSLLVGPSGCGKSTLAKLLQGFYPPADGLIRIDGTDIRHMSANELRSLFGVVPQETILFSGTIYDNLLLANPHADFEQVLAACKAAEIHEVIERLPQSYQTPIGEHGVGLSGGQKQRIAIARALLKKPKILIFDEATSNLDGETAEAFARTVNGLKGQVTVLFIAHVQPKALQVDETFVFGARPKPKDAKPAAEPNPSPQ